MKFRLFFCGIVVALIAVDIAQKSQSQKRPGPERGDISVKADCLADVIDDWTFLEFIDAEDSTSSDSQWWWSHSWRYVRSNEFALVAFDQLGLDVWHELTSCYRAVGWTLVERTIKDGPVVNGRKWQYVQADLAKDSGESAILLFSAFFADGTPCVPEQISLDGKFIFEMNTLERLREATVNQRHSQEQGFISGRGCVLQCQTICQYNTDKSPPSVHRLHLESRESMRLEWLRQKKKKRK